ncbi:MAG: polyprenyl synthetase family protein [Spirochaetaceae bacterium]|jgi:octaprenyl-diphosphate synthase|nr:polyprenyl synthetase family protein [Spirochaetaceae bacterium]
MGLDYTSRLQKIEAVLQKSLPSNPDEGWFSRNFFADKHGFTESPETMALVYPLLEPGLDLLNRGGKRWRPLLALLICESLGGGDAVLPLSPLVEFCHNASLIHDDIEDNSVERRGKPAVHLLYGTDTAINSACFLYFLPLSCIDGWDAPDGAKLKLYSVWARELRSLHLGQSLDIAWHRNIETLPSVADYYRMCALKTGVLARFAVNAGYLSASLSAADGLADAPALPELEKAARNLGVGFQILDDVKNLVEGVPGKKRGDDIIEGKKSLPVLLYLHGAAAGGVEAERRRRLVSRCFKVCKSAAPGAPPPPEAEELISALDKAGCLEKAAEEGRGLLSQAENIFSRIGFAGKPSTEAQELLAGFSGLIG